MDTASSHQTYQNKICVKKTLSGLAYNIRHLYSYASMILSVLDFLKHLGFVCLQKQQTSESSIFLNLWMLLMSNFIFTCKILPPKKKKKILPPTIQLFIYIKYIHIFINNLYVLPICILFLRVVLGSEKNWKEDTGISGIPSAIHYPPLPRPQTLPKPSFPHYQHHSSKWLICYSWWTYIDTS